MPVSAGEYSSYGPTDNGLFGGSSYDPRRDVDDREFMEYIRQEQIFFHEQEYHERAPLRPRLERGDAYSPESPYWGRVDSYRRPRSSFQVLDSYFDVYWDTPSYTSNRESTPLITHLFRDAAVFPTPPGYGRGQSGITPDKFMQIAINRWERHSREAYPIHGYWSLQDFSKENTKLVKGFMDKFANINFWADYQARQENGYSYAQSFQMIEGYIREYRLPVICLLNDRAVLVYKIVRRNDGDAAMFYWDPADPVNMRLKNEFDASRVIYVRQGYDMNRRPIGIQFFRITGFQQTRFVLEPCTGRYRKVSGSQGRVHSLDVQPITDMAAIYRRIAPWMAMGGYWAGLTGADGVSTTQKVKSWTNVLASGILFADAQDRGSDGESIGYLMNGLFGSTQMSLGPGSGMPTGAYGPSDSLYMPPSMTSDWMARGSAPGPYYDPVRDPVYDPFSNSRLPFPQDSSGRPYWDDQDRYQPFDGYRGDRYWENDRGRADPRDDYYRTPPYFPEDRRPVTAGYDLDRFFDWPFLKDPSYGGGRHPQPPPRYRPGYPDDAFPPEPPTPPSCQRCPPPPCNPCDPPEPPDPGYDDPANCLEITLKVKGEEFCPGKSMPIQLFVRQTKDRIRLRENYNGEIVIDGTSRRIPFVLKKGGYGNSKKVLVSTSVPAPRSPNPYLIHAKVHGVDLRDQAAIRVLHPSSSECGGDDDGCHRPRCGHPEPEPVEPEEPEDKIKCLELTVKLDKDDFCKTDDVRVTVTAQSTGKAFQIRNTYTGKVVFDKTTYNFTLPTGTYGERERQVYSKSHKAPNRMGTHAVWAYVHPKDLGVADSTTFYVDDCDDDGGCQETDPCGERRRRRRHDQDQDQDQDRRRHLDAIENSSLKGDERLTITTEGHIVTRKK